MLKEGGKERENGHEGGRIKGERRERRGRRG